MAVAAAEEGLLAVRGLKGDDLTAVGYFQPVTRSEPSKILGKDVSRDAIGALRGAGFTGSGPRSPALGSYVTTKQFLSAFGME